MPGRAAILGNGAVAVGIDEFGLVHDFYFPYVGLDNLNNARIHPHLIGVHVNGTFSWLNDGSWETSVTLADDAMIALSKHAHSSLGIEILMESFVDVDYNMFVRHVSVRNTTDSPRDVRLFFHQVFQISRDGRSDTAMYVPDGHYILDYKGQVSALIKAEFDNGEAFDQYAVGSFRVDGKEGTFRDAEDGELSMSAVEHAGVDSVIRLSTRLEPQTKRQLHYWVALSNSQFAAKKTNDYLLQQGLGRRKDKQYAHWKKWLAPANNTLSYLSADYRSAVVKSLFTIKAHMDRHGGIIASCDSSIYNYGRDYYSYVWPRDGAFAVWPFIKLGLYSEVKKFFEFCSDVRAPGGYMMHKYQPDRSVGSTWHPLVHNNTSELAIQEDETALILIMIGEYLNYSKDVSYIRSLYTTMVKPMANFLAKFIDEQTGLPHASYDLWEEKFLTTAFSTAATYKALHVAASIAELLKQSKDSTTWLHTATELQKRGGAFYDNKHQRIRKGFVLRPDSSVTNDDTLDVSSMYGPMIFDYTSSHASVAQTVQAIENTLLDQSPSGGTPRYENDAYFLEKQQYKGNPWIVTTLWMAQYYAANNQPDKAKHYVNWAMSKRLPSGVLSEQLDPETGQPVGVTPLVWSHAELVNSILMLIK